MGRLEDINNELYQPSDSEQPKPRFFAKPKAHAEAASQGWETKPRSGPPPAPPGPRRSLFSRFHWIALGILIAGISSVIAIFFFGFEQEPLRVSVLAKAEVEAGEKVTYQIIYKNTGREDLKDLELSFTYPPGAVPLNDQVEVGKIPRTRIILSDLPGGREGKVELEARLFGRKDEVKRAEAVILYRPEASTARFVSKANSEVVLIRVPLVLTINVPQELVSGQESTIVIDYASNAESIFQEMHLGITYPPGFEPMVFDPKPAYGNSVWKLGSIAPGDSGKISITGKITGAPSEIKTFSAEMGLYNDLQKDWTAYQVASVGSQLSTPLLSVEQRINESRDVAIKSGEEMRVRLHYRNTLDVPLKNVSLEVQLKARSASTPVEAEDVLDLRLLSVEKGFYNGTTKRIMWSPASASEFSLLPPHAEGDLFFTVRLNPLLGIDMDFLDLTIESVAHIRTTEIPPGFEGVDLSSKDSVIAKVVARPVLSSLALYRNQYQPNGGPLPPRVGEKTSYTIFWQLSNSFSDVRDVEVRAKLSPAAAWENKYVPDGSALSYDPSSGVIMWRVGRLAAGAGRAKAAPYIAYQISITAGPDQVGKSPLLLSGIEVRGRDAFTGEAISLQSPNVTTELKGDPTTSDKDWVVVR